VELFESLKSFRGLGGNRGRNKRLKCFADVANSSRSKHSFLEIVTRTEGGGNFLGLSAFTARENTLPESAFILRPTNKTRVNQIGA
jgi:hypothetical protein